MIRLESLLSVSVDDGFDDLPIGAPGENITTANRWGQLQIQEDAGTRAVLYGVKTSGGLAEQARDEFWTQFSATGSFTAEAGDVFGGGLYGYVR